MRRYVRNGDLRAHLNATTVMLDLERKVVSPNLLAALKHLRFEDRNRILWVDGVVHQLRWHCAEERSG